MAAREYHPAQKAREGKEKIAYGLSNHLGFIERILILRASSTVYHPYVLHIIE